MNQTLIIQFKHPFTPYYLNTIIGTGIHNFKKFYISDQEYSTRIGSSFYRESPKKRLKRREDVETLQQESDLRSEEEKDIMLETEDDEDRELPYQWIDEETTRVMYPPKQTSGRTARNQGLPPRIIRTTSESTKSVSPWATNSAIETLLIRNSNSVFECNLFKFIFLFTHINCNHKIFSIFTSNFSFLVFPSHLSSSVGGSLRVLAVSSC